MVLAPGVEVEEDASASGEMGIVVREGRFRSFAVVDVVVAVVAELSNFSLPDDLLLYFFEEAAASRNTAEHNESAMEISSIPK